MNRFHPQGGGPPPDGQNWYPQAQPHGGVAGMTKRGPTSSFQGEQRAPPAGGSRQFESPAARGAMPHAAGEAGAATHGAAGGQKFERSLLMPPSLNLLMPPSLPSGGSGG
eukprot:CAMPEP_0173439900 /NCGR_PEP_ID=MMETSP1357-20121228/21836_1 /TAXON_ID=77926 /ORGANISM="Hemiselmis rufescens, Strain PCC563" /LENGTH=109 /DNA_ID=CAMNT_0014405313 /DNA_START=89 /DNA_END=414 /DNA_ORIENTATION=+